MIVTLKTYTDPISYQSKVVVVLDGKETSVFFTHETINEMGLHGTEGKIELIDILMFELMEEKLINIDQDVDLVKQLMSIIT